jgi:hypothetical protein
MHGTCFKIKSSQYIPSKHWELLTGPRRPEFSCGSHHSTAVELPSPLSEVITLHNYTCQYVVLEIIYQHD